MKAAVDVDLASGALYINILIAGFFINLAGDLFVHKKSNLSANHSIYHFRILRIPPLLSLGCGLSARPL